MIKLMAVLPVALMVFSGLGLDRSATQDDKKPAPTLTAKLIDQEAKAKKKAAPKLREIFRKELDRMPPNIGACLRRLREVEAASYDRNDSRDQSASRG